MAQMNGRKVQRFRCTIDPMIPPRPRNAFDCGPKGDCKGWEFELTPAGVYVKALIAVPGQPVQLEEHVIPFANIQSIKFFPEEPKTPKPETTKPDAKPETTKPDAGKTDGGK